MLSRILSHTVKAGVATFAFTLAVAALPSAHAQILTQFNFGTAINTTNNGAGYAPSAINPNVTASNVVPTAGSTPAVGLRLDTLYTGAGATLIIDPRGANTPATAVAGNQAFDFSVTPNTGFQASFSSLTFSAGKGGPGEPRGYILRSSVDGFTTDIASGTITVQRPNFAAVSIPLTGIAFQNVLTTTTFRIYSYTPFTGNTLDYDNVTVNGTVAAVAATVPEASTLALLPLAGGLGLIIARRRKK